MTLVPRTALFVLTLLVQTGSLMAWASVNPSEFRALQEWLVQTTGHSYEIETLKGLQGLDLSNKQINTFPSGLSHLKKLASLDLSHNNLTDIPPEIAQLNVWELNLSHNRLKALPSEIGQMRYLVELNLSHNQLKELPSSVASWQNLRHPYIDPDVSNMKILKTLPRLGELKVGDEQYIGKENIHEYLDSLS